MAENTTGAPGTFCWVELSTTNPDAAKDFYGKLLGWTLKDEPVPELGTYTTLFSEGKDVGGLYKQRPEQKAQNIPPNWLSYVAVKDADATAKRAGELGGKIHAAPFDVMELGRMAVLQDPTGAVFAVWQGKKHKGAQAIGGQHGNLVWNELMTSDADRAGKYYVDLFGWQPKPGGVVPGYTEFHLGGRGIAGMMQIQKEWGPVPPHWTVYFAVSDCDKTAQKAKELGAKIIQEPMEIPKVGKFAALQDPQGAHFSIIKVQPR